MMHVVSVYFMFVLDTPFSTFGCFMCCEFYITASPQVRRVGGCALLIA